MPAGTESQLNGCVMDVDNIHDLLVNTMGFTAEGITMLVDEGESATEDNYPSKANIEVILLQLSH
jgi:hypothetical protein